LKIYFVPQKYSVNRIDSFISNPIKRMKNSRRNFIKKSTGLAALTMRSMEKDKAGESYRHGLMEAAGKGKAITIWIWKN
jgi:hypothetical protein